MAAIASMALSSVTALSEMHLFDRARSVGLA
jgi:hypothetical protein